LLPSGTIVSERRNRREADHVEAMMTTQKLTDHTGEEMSDESLETVTGGSVGAQNVTEGSIGSQSSGAGAGKVTFNPFSITRKIDKSSPTF
jgi:type VI protein secretion system component Hcp